MLFKLIFHRLEHVKQQKSFQSVEPGVELGGALNKNFMKKKSYIERIMNISPVVIK